MLKQAQTIGFLKEVPLFAQFREDELKLLVQAARQQRFEPGTLIIRENEMGNEFFLVLEGQVEVRKGKEPLAILNAGQFFGEMVFLDEMVRSADVVVTENTRCLVLTNDLLHELILTHPDMALKMMAELARRLRNTDQESYAVLEQRVADRTRELSALYEITAVASEALDLETTLKRLLERSLEAMGANMGTIQLLDEAGDRLTLATHQGFPPHLIQEMASVPSNQGVSKRVLERQEPLLISDITQHPKAAEIIADRCPHAYLGVPMRAKGKVLGVLSILRETARPFNVEEVALLATIADQVGVVVENARLRQQAEEAAVMEERGRLARDLHDSVTQSIYSVTLFAEAARRLIGDGELANTKDYLEQLRDTSQQALKELRLLVYELRPALLKQEGLIGALRQRLSTVEERANIHTKLIHKGTLKLKKPVEVGLYHIAQEALNNALKHASASQVTVRILAHAKQVTLEITDNGVGFDPRSVAQHGGGVGMASMQERTTRLGGTLQVISAPGQGTSIRVRVGLS